jgi:hypothetical protein
VSQEQSIERLRELAKAVARQLPEGVFYSLVIWPPGEPTDVAYFSNAQRAEAVVAIQTISSSWTKRLYQKL